MDMEMDSGLRNLCARAPQLLHPDPNDVRIQAVHGDIWSYAGQHLP